MEKYIIAAAASLIMLIALPANSETAEVEPSAATQAAK